ncbi:helix-turn-helix domain-containing protein [Streptococcus gallolyticus]|uniref:Cro/CI family transcriptional regulator n=6 Tax=Streptococcus gallolyticus TaxID=315405 RepID=A0AA94S9J7_9STRE|nr:XRE family transcriptional regulator [Streptococcus gallolyticus]AQP41100.1 transcriptional regulator [Streptococcus gallolyticus subsp. gallolyticus DSM 16831]MCY7166527.1 helix-turn-helix domain-containing protein [Streptococcus gallolyticus subsp. gallolyticus]MCY7183908.1 helix-turn-helix domain-containing protein [Streptococcus gallolyticus subsp. gallolyticus]SQG78378.1 Cro/CI family transcriptional regulator [Streptococcus gallolyticus]
MEKFGIKVRALREEKGISREEFCGDETELSVRQLARIESNQSIPSLSKAQFIANQLGVTLGTMTDGDSLELPRRYEELKYLLIRTPTYGDKVRLGRKGEYFDEISEKFYDIIPEEERLIIDCLQAKLDVHFSDDVNFGEGILNDYFDQVNRKQLFNINDLILIDLYFICLESAKTTEGIYSITFYDKLMKRLINQKRISPETDLILNNVLLNNIDLAFKYGRENYVERVIEISNSIMTEIHDFQRRPILSLVEWKYYLKFKHDFVAAEQSFTNATLFARLVGDTYLENKLKEEWKLDTTT